MDRPRPLPRAEPTRSVSRRNGSKSAGISYSRRGGDSKALMEAAVGGREVDVAVLAHPDGRIEAGPPLEIRVPGDRSFFDFDANYRDGNTIFDIPARLDPQTTTVLQERAVQVFRALGCSGLLRVGFFVQEGHEPVVNEVNTFPGFTAASQFPRIWQAAGPDYAELLDTMIETALRVVAGRPLSGLRAAG